jgi:hypothetical protein
MRIGGDMGRGARVFIPNTLAQLHAIPAIKDIGLCSTNEQWCREKVNFWLSCHEIWFTALVEWFCIGTTNVSPICFALSCPDSNILIEQAPRCRQKGPGKVYRWGRALKICRRGPAPSLCKTGAFAASKTCVL